MDRCLVPSYVESIVDTYGISSHLACEFICGDYGNDGLANGCYRYMPGCIPKIIDKIMSYTFLDRLRIIYQRSGAKLSSGDDSFVFERMIVLASKHFIARDVSTNTHSKGISYVRWTGSEIQDICAKTFSDIILSTSDPELVIRQLRVAYHRVIQSIRSHNHRHLYRIRTTRNMITRDYVRMINADDRYVEFEHMDDDTIDDGYYIDIVRSSLRSICRCIGLSDETFITCN